MLIFIQPLFISLFFSNTYLLFIYLFIFPWSNCSWALWKEKKPLSVGPEEAKLRVY